MQSFNTNSGRCLQVLKAPGIFEHRAAGVGQHYVFGGPIEKFLAELAFKALQSE